MKKLLPREFSKLYLEALRTHLGQNKEVTPESACDIGRHAVASGLETLDLAIVHEHALLRLLLPDISLITQKNLAKRAMEFFTEAITPIEKTHPIAMKAKAEMNQLNERLSRLTASLADSNNELQQSITMREAAEKALQTGRDIAGKLLEESGELHERLQEMTRQLFTVQEEERKTMSLKLQDEIAQSMLGIQLRLLALKKEVTLSNTDLKKEIAITQRWVEKSVRAINRTARGLTH